MLRRQEDTWERVTSKWVMRIDRMLGYHNITISADVSIWEWSRVRFLTNLASSDSKVFLTARTDGTGKLLLQCPSRTLSIYAHDNCVKSSDSCWPASANFITLFQERSGQLSFDEFYKVRIVPHHRSTPAPIVGLSRQVMTLLAQREGFSKTECNVAWLKSKLDTVWGIYGDILGFRLIYMDLYDITYTIIACGTARRM